MKRHIGLLAFAMFLAFALLCIPACDPVQIDSTSAAVAGAIDQSEPVVDALENATGQGLSDDTVSKGEQVSKVIQKGANIGAVVAKFTPTPIDDVVFAGAAAIAGAAYGFFQRRKAKNLAKAAVLAAEKTRKGGAAIVAEAGAAGVAADIKVAYAAAIASEDIDPKASLKAKEAK
jgi:hypothetical protein